MQRKKDETLKKLKLWGKNNDDDTVEFLFTYSEGKMKGKIQEKWTFWGENLHLKSLTNMFSMPPKC